MYFFRKYNVMETYERINSNGNLVFGEKTPLAYCPTYHLRSQLKQLGVSSVGWTRKDCVFQLNRLGYYHLCLDSSFSPNRLAAPNYAISRSVKERPSFMTRSAPVFADTNTDTRSRDTSAVNPLYDGSFQNITCENMNVFKTLMIEKDNITTRINDLREKVEFIRDNVKLYNPPTNIADLGGENKFPYRSFGNIGSPFINLYNGVGLFLSIDMIPDNRLIYDYTQSYVHMIDRTTFYEMNIEIHGIYWFNVDVVEHQSQSLEVLDLKIITGIPTDLSQATFHVPYFELLKTGKWKQFRRGLNVREGGVFDLNTTTRLDTIDRKSVV